MIQRRMRRRRWRRNAAVLIALVVCSAFLFHLAGDALAEGDQPASVFVLPVEGTMEAGLASFVRRGVQQAEEQGADVLLVRITTLGGTIDSALDIRDMLLETPLDTVAFIKGRAWSAGVLVAIACEQVIMAPGSSIGAAEPRPAEEKIISAWRAELEETAIHRGRDPKLLAAMVDSDMEIEGVVEEGKLLTLTASRAMELGLIDGISATEMQALASLGIHPAEMVSIQPTTLEMFARFATSPFVAPLLLAAGFFGLLVEVVMPGFGVFGLLGLSSLAAYFVGHIAAGYAGLSIALLFVFGMGLLVTEAFIPEFGVLGMGGMLAMMASIYLASPTPVAAMRSILVAFGTLVATVVVLIRMGHRFPLWRRLLLSEVLTTAGGYVSQSSLKELEGQRGVTITPLRPAGTVEFDGIRADVVSEGGFISSGVTVDVIRVAGRRVVVRPVVDQK